MYRDDADEYVLSTSMGKDSLACLGATGHLGWKLTRIVHAEVWATKDIPAELPPMVEFKKKAEAIIKEKWGLTVEKYSSGTTYEEEFYRVFTKGKRKGQIVGFPFQQGAWCNSRLKMKAVKKIKAGRNSIEYIGIANDEPKRFKKLKGNILSPLVELGWEEDLCGLWCKYSDLLSPDYETGCRGGCWFCHNQSTEQLRNLRKKYPEYWQLLLKWDNDSPVPFKPNGITVHDYDKRFEYEDLGLVPTDKTFRWDMLKRDFLQMKFVI